MQKSERQSSEFHLELFYKLKDRKGNGSVNGFSLFSLEIQVRATGWFYSIRLLTKVTHAVTHIDLIHFAESNEESMFDLSTVSLSSYSHFRRVNLCAEVTFILSHTHTHIHTRFLSLSLFCPHTLVSVTR